jgi:hypothetical protein
MYCRFSYISILLDAAAVEGTEILFHNATLQRAILTNYNTGRIKK